MTDRRMEKEVVYEATPDQVWQAIATGPGISAWFVPHQVEQREGGRIQGNFGPGYAVEGRVTAWEPGRRFAYGAFDAPDNAEHPDYSFEFLIQGRDDGTTVLRFVQTGFLDGEGWDAEYDALDKGWDLFFYNLGEYLTHFAGRPVTNVVTMGFTPLNKAAAWSKIRDALGIDVMPAVGEEVRLTPEGFAPIIGVVDVVTDEFLGVRTSDALYRFGAEGEDGCGVSAYHYFYGNDIATAAQQNAWHAWLTALFPMPEPAPVT